MQFNLYYKNITYSGISWIQIKNENARNHMVLLLEELQIPL